MTPLRPGQIWLSRDQLCRYKLTDVKTKPRKRYIKHWILGTWDSTEGDGFVDMDLDCPVYWYTKQLCYYFDRFGEDGPMDLVSLLYDPPTT